MRPKKYKEQKYIVVIISCFTIDDDSKGKSGQLTEDATDSSAAAPPADQPTPA